MQNCIRTLKSYKTTAMLQALHQSALYLTLFCTYLKEHTIKLCPKSVINDRGKTHSLCPLQYHMFSCKKRPPSNDLVVSLYRLTSHK